MMAKRKKKLGPGPKEFGSNPFSDLRGFAVSLPKEQAPPAPVTLETGPAVEVFGTFAEEMELLGVERLPAATEDPEGGSQEPQSRENHFERPVEPQTDEELFLQSVGELQVRFSDHLPEADEPVAGSARRLKQLKQGRLVPEAVLDLHGLQRAEVADKIRFFLQNAGFHDWRTLLVITGKGKHSADGESVLRHEAEQFFRGEGRKWVVEWCRAPRKYGGDGALVLFLRKP
jgi:DNA-nicking Smr family endonuclease